MNTHARLLVPALILAVACTPAEEKAPEPAASAAPPPAPAVATAMFMSPMDGDTSAADVKVSLMSHDVAIEPAATGVKPGSGHYHLFLDMDPSPAGAPIPANGPQLQHLGDGSAEFTFKAVKPGAHRLIVVLADGAHVPIAGAVADTVNFAVK